MQVMAPRQVLLPKQSLSQASAALTFKLRLPERQGVISLPSGGIIVTGPATFGTFTNLSDPTKNVTLSMTGVFHVSSDQNGNTIVKVTGRGVAEDPSFGLLLLVGEFTLVFDPQGNIISGPTGNGQIINICQLIN